MIKLSPRLQAMADFVAVGESLADIGTDHGFLPLYLEEKKICPKVILSDINEGPLEKARMNIARHSPGKVFDIRLGNGLTTIEKGEVDAIVIAGMGGMLMEEIIGADMEQAKSYKRFILQPRNAPEKLRKWLMDNGFLIRDEKLVQEGKFICEIIMAKPSKNQRTISDRNKLFAREIDFEVSPILVHNGDPLLRPFIINKIRIEKNIVKNLLHSTREDAEEKRSLSQKRIQLLTEIVEGV